MARGIPRLRILCRDRDDVANDYDGDGGDERDAAHANFVGEVRVEGDPDGASEEGWDGAKLNFNSAYYRRGDIVSRRFKRRRRTYCMSLEC